MNPRLTTWVVFVLGFVILYAMVPAKGRIPLLVVLLIGGAVYLDRRGGPGLAATIQKIKGVSEVPVA